MNEIERAVVAGNEADTSTKGQRGEVGESSTALHIRQMWHDAHFKRVSIKTMVKEPFNENKQVFVAHPGAPSLKRFARDLAAKGDAAAKEWLSNKAGAKNQKRTDANIALARTCAGATHLERRKKKADNK